MTEFLTGLGLGRYGVLALIMVMVVELGLIHPPVGMNISVIKSVIEDVSIATIFYACCRSSSPASCGSSC